MLETSVEGFAVENQSAASPDNSRSPFEIIFGIICLVLLIPATFVAFEEFRYIIDDFEYDSDTLKQEYDRDTEKGNQIKVPKNYYPGDNPAEKPDNRWRSHGHLLYGNWINSIYQSTPYNIDKIGT